MSAKRTIWTLFDKWPKRRFGLRMSSPRPERNRPIRSDDHVSLWTVADPNLGAVAIDRNRRHGDLAGSVGVGNAGTATATSAREEAIRSVLLAERRRSELRAKAGRPAASTEDRAPDEVTTEIPSVPPEILIEHLRKENDELKDTVDSLREEVKRLRASKRAR